MLVVNVFMMLDFKFSAGPMIVYAAFTVIALVAPKVRECYRTSKNGSAPTREILWQLPRNPIPSAKHINCNVIMNPITV